MSLASSAPTMFLVGCSPAAAADLFVVCLRNGIDTPDDGVSPAGEIASAIIRDCAGRFAIGGEGDHCTTVGCQSVAAHAILPRVILSVLQAREARRKAGR